MSSQSLLKFKLLQVSNRSNEKIEMKVTYTISQFQNFKWRENESSLILRGVKL